VEKRWWEDAVGWREVYIVTGNTGLDVAMTATQFHLFSALERRESGMVKGKG
jgi:hypothetical protein